jgi:Holliday junction DNA helicase RuvA
MFAYLNGKLTYKSPTQIYVDCNGVGYQVNITLYTYSDIELLESAKLYTYFYVREDQQVLYGFSTEQEKQMFIHLISVSGVGPNTARLILSSMTTNELANAIINEEVSLIQTVKGIGPKSAKRLVLELKDKMKSIETSNIATASNSSANHLVEEAVAALMMLGFSKNQTEVTVMKLWKSNTVKSVEELIKLSLKNL